MDFVEICNVYVGQIIIKAAERIFNADKICSSYSDLNFGVTFLEHSVYRDDSYRVAMKRFYHSDSYLKLSL